MRNLVVRHETPEGPKHYAVLSWLEDKQVFILFEGRIRNLDILKGQDYKIIVDRKPPATQKPAQKSKFDRPKSPPLDRQPPKSFDRPRPQPQPIKPITVSDKLPIRRKESE